MNTNLKNIEFEQNAMRLIFGDGGSCLVPLRDFPRLLAATDLQRKSWEIIGSSRGIHWPMVDEDLSIPRLIADYANPISSSIVSSSVQESHL